MDFVKYHEEPIRLSSGRMSHWFVDGRAIFDDERLRELVLAFWERRLAFDRYRWHLVPVPTGGDRWTQALAERVGASWGEAISLHAERVAVVEDVVTTGASARRKVEEVQEAVGLPYMDMPVGRRWLSVPVLVVVWRRAVVQELNVLAWARMVLPDFKEVRGPSSP